MRNLLCTPHPLYLLSTTVFYPLQRVLRYPRHSRIATIHTNLTFLHRWACAARMDVTV